MLYVTNISNFVIMAHIHFIFVTSKIPMTCTVCGDRAVRGFRVTGAYNSIFILLFFIFIQLAVFFKIKASLLLRRHQKS